MKISVPFRFLLILKESLVFDGASKTEQKEIPFRHLCHSASSPRMPGPQMGPRPPDFDEVLIRQSPTFNKWTLLNDGETLRYACRDFVKGHGDDEERLMRRIMIARRNNLKDHEMLKRARAADAMKRAATGATASKASEITSFGKSDNAVSGVDETEAGAEDKKKNASSAGVALARTRRRRLPGTNFLTDEEVLLEMDIPAVEATRSYRKWLSLEDGEKFTYNQLYIKGMMGADWLLKKNIWRRMRYRRENRKMVKRMNATYGCRLGSHSDAPSNSNWRKSKLGKKNNNSNKYPKVETKKKNTVEEKQGRTIAEQREEESLRTYPVFTKAAIEAAIAAAESFVGEGIDAEAVAALSVDGVINPTFKRQQEPERVPEMKYESNNDETGSASHLAIDVSSVPSALDAAAKLAASVVPADLDGEVGGSPVINL